MIRNVTDSDHAAITALYNHYIAQTVATFEEQAISHAQMAERVASVATQGLPWLVAEAAGEIIGYAYASLWQSRSAYRFSVAATIYLHPQHTGQGWGRQLYQPLFARLRQEGHCHAVVAGITLPNSASQKLHETMGMTKVAHFSEVGFKFGQWWDVGYWQLTFAEAAGN
ncbi:GNAT family N-acetyltransferase [Halioxenophilus sp. WMMB6]|uniref:GNAT family N-acetyltransferase n=1 Tax=Halioxenophilus sp. WMMB6 TaxID=3073815 RepID=UPI00295E567A|nr:GNAT family N-acetyltransferase [Halioxenophilus sp. WMMB6]